MSNIPITIFDDDDFVDAVELRLDAIVEHCGEYVTSRYGSRGFSGIKLTLCRIESDEDFNSSATLCRDGLHGIAVFDLLLNNVNRSACNDHLKHLSTSMPTVFEAACKTALGDDWRTAICNNAGVVLACLAVSSKNNEADVYLGSSNSELRGPCAKLLESMLSSRQNQFDLEMGILALSTEILLREKLKKLIDQYIENRGVSVNRLQELFWPRDSKDWFLKDEKLKFGDVPHTFEKFHELYKSHQEKLSSPLGSYLLKIVRLGSGDGNESKFVDAVVSFLSQTRFYDMLKYFVGAGAFLSKDDANDHKGKHRPRTCSFIVPLLAAYGLDDLVKSAWNPTCQRNVLGVDRPVAGGRVGFEEGDCSRTRNLLVKATLLFRALKSDSSKITKIQFEVGCDLDFLIIQCTIDPIKRSLKNGGERGARQPLLTLTQFRAAEKSDGTMAAVNDFYDACKPARSEEDRAVYTWFLPGDSSGTTELRIGVADRG